MQIRVLPREPARLAEEADPDLESKVKWECDLSTLPSNKTALDSGEACAA